MPLLPRKKTPAQRRPRRLHARTAIAAEPLESRTLLSAVLPSNLEQYMLELMNRARANPSAEAARYGIDLNEGLPAGTISAAPKLRAKPSSPLAQNLHP